MRFPSFIGAALMAATFLPSPAGALPGPVAPDAGDGMLVRVSGCHRDVQRHWVPELGRRAWHYHRGSSCRPIEVESPAPPPPAAQDCHRDIRRHYVPEYGRRLTHRHVGQRCRIEIME